MTTSLMRVMSAINERVVPKFWIGYFRESFRGEVNDQLLQAFESASQTKADIARKLDRRPEQITRWLSAPSNLEIDTISDLALSLGLVPKLSFEKIGVKATNEWVHSFVAIQERSSQVSASTGSSPSARITGDFDVTRIPIPPNKRVSRTTDAVTLVEITTDA